jgi:hypothetical protein
MRRRSHSSSNNYLVPSDAAKRSLFSCLGSIDRQLSLRNGCRSLSRGTVSCFASFGVLDEMLVLVLSRIYSSSGKGLLFVLCFA